MSVLQGYAQRKFNCLYKELDDIYHKLALKAGLSDSAFLVLYAIVDMGDGCVQKEISECFSLSRQTINSSVKNLQEKGYISLTKGNGRDKHIHLTAKGQKYVEDKIIPIIKLENDVFDAMLPEDREKLLALSEKYICLFQQMANQFYNEN